ncbi:GTPase-activating protein [Ophidiomyces ophidiicola]|nr:GTPase-activating protein [Ophidiomyces ophidiicola]KAI2316230.1 GTPase-activating protein [Ophidiomyces ophidiicola]KAI2339090.1 GTPase-activating protein [Ophidiomyces ophidiicola]
MASNEHQKESKKQEMVQVGPCLMFPTNALLESEPCLNQAKRTPSLWRSQPLSQKQSPTRIFDSNTVVGASYSHADLLKSISPQSTPRTTTKSPFPRRSNRNISNSTTSLNRNVQSPHQAYRNLLPQAGETWTSRNNDNESDENEDDLAYDDDEDEFGLPSITSMRKPTWRQPQNNERDHSGIDVKGSSTLLPDVGSMRLRANSSDIAEERGILAYPNAKTTEGKILRPQYKEIVNDPANSLHLIDHSPPPAGATAKETEAHSARIGRINKFKRILQSSTVSLPELRDLAWSGIPQEVRAMTWKLLLGYLPTNSERRMATLERKRKEYLDGVQQAFERNHLIRSRSPTKSIPENSRGLDEAIWHQISIDIPRTNPHIPLYGFEATQRSLERILYLWAIRHPASGYVQGINDLVTPFWQVFLGSYVTDFDIEEGMDPGQLPKQVLNAVEADSFWCLTKLLDGIQDNYIYAQPGIHRQVNALHDLTKRIDATLVKHLEAEGIEFMQFSFRWMNCLLMREISIKSTIRMWDTYMAEEQGFSRFHLYVCAAFLVKWSDQLLRMDFQVRFFRFLGVRMQLIVILGNYDVSPSIANTRMD